MSVLVTVTYDDDVTLRISNEELALEHYWEPWLVSVDNVSFQMEYTYGGAAIPEWGSLSISIKAFENEDEIWPPPKFINVVIEHTKTTEAAAETLFENVVGNLVSMDDVSATYNLFIEDELDILLLDTTASITARTTTAYDGTEVIIPRAVGTVVYQTPLRLNDYDGGSSTSFDKPCYHTGYMQGTLDTDWHVFDDGVDICANVIVGTSGTSGDDTFYLNYEAVGEVTVSGNGTFDSGEDITDSVDALITAKGLSANGVNTYQRTGDAKIGDWVSTQTTLKRYISKLSASHGHLFSVLATSPTVVFYSIKLEYEFASLTLVFTDVDVLPVNYENQEVPIFGVKTTWPYREQVDEGGRVFVKEVTNELNRDNSVYFYGTADNSSSGEYSSAAPFLLYDASQNFTYSPGSLGGTWAGSDKMRPGFFVKNTDDLTTTTVVEIIDDTILSLNDDIFVGGEDYEIGYHFEHGQELSIQSFSLDESTIKDNLKFIINFVHQRFTNVHIPMETNTIKPTNYGTVGLHVIEEHRFERIIRNYRNKVVGVIYDFENEKIIYRLVGRIYEESA